MSATCQWPDVVYTLPKLKCRKIVKHGGAGLGSRAKLIAVSSRRVHFT